MKVKMYTLMMTKGKDQEKIKNIFEDMKHIFGDTDLANQRKLDQRPVVGKAKKPPNFVP